MNITSVNIRDSEVDIGYIQGGILVWTVLAPSKPLRTRGRRKLCGGNGQCHRLASAWGANA